MTILLVEQRVAEALELSDHGYVLETGHMVLEGPYETLLADDRVRKSYLGLTDDMNEREINTMPLIKPLGRRGALSLAGAAALAGKARADNPAEVKIAMMVPLSGPVGAQRIAGADGRPHGHR